MSLGSDPVFKSRLADFLYSVQFPATKERVEATLVTGNAPEYLVEAVSLIPDRLYSSFDDLASEVLGMLDRIPSVAGSVW
jgi:hypothetical protein